MFLSGSRVQHKTGHGDGADGWDGKRGEQRVRQLLPAGLKCSCLMSAFFWTEFWRSWGHWSPWTRASSSRSKSFGLTARSAPPCPASFPKPLPVSQRSLPLTHSSALWPFCSQICVIFLLLLLPYQALFSIISDHRCVQNRWQNLCSQVTYFYISSRGICHFLPGCNFGCAYISWSACKETAFTL